MMKTNVKMTLKAAVLSLTLLTSLHAFASGDGRSGDDQSGVSIPVAIEHRLIVENFDKAVATCRLAAAHSLVSQMVRQQVTESQVKSLSMFNNIYGFQTDTQKLGFFIYIGENSPNFRHQDPAVAFGSSGFEAHADTISVSPQIDQALRALVNQQAVFDGGLQINFDVKKDSSYDEFGSLRQEIAIVTSYTVTELPMIRRLETENRPTQLRLSASDFKQCMQNILN